MTVPGDFFKSQGPPELEAIVLLPGFQRARQKIALDITRKEGNIRLIVGPRGVGKSTCLYFLHRFVQQEGALNRSRIFDAGLHIPELLDLSHAERVNRVFVALANAISDGAKSSLVEVAKALRQRGTGPYFLFIDNLDRLYKEANDLDFVKRFFQDADPTLKSLASRLVIVFSCAPEWEPFLAEEDLSYLNYPNRITLEPLTKEELEDLVTTRAESVGVRLDSILEADVMPALHVASRGNPRRAFQYLEKAIAGVDATELPISETKFRGIVQAELYEGAIDTLRGLASSSPEISWGVNQLYRFFVALQKAGIDEGTAIANLITAQERMTVPEDQTAALIPAWRNVAHRAAKGGWSLNQQVKTALAEWAKATKMEKAVLLSAFSESPFTATTTDVEKYAEEYSAALEDLPEGADDFAESLREYVALVSKRVSDWDRKELCHTAWRCVERLMLAVLAFRDSTPPYKLRSELSSPESVRAASELLLERIDGLYRSRGRANTYRAELRSLRERMLDILENPTVVDHWENHQLEQTWKQGQNSYEGLIRGLRPKRIVHADERIDLQWLLKQKEGINLEFKSSLRWDLRQKKRDDALKWPFLRTVAAFMNTEGGRIVIGVADNRDIVGLRFDYQTLKDQNEDGFERLVYDTIAESLGTAVCAQVKVDFEEIGNDDVAVVSVTGAPRPAYLRKDGRELFLMRTGNSTRELDMHEANAYIREHWRSSE